MYASASRPDAGSRPREGSGRSWAVLTVGLPFVEAPSERHGERALGGPAWQVLNLIGSWKNGVKRRNNALRRWPKLCPTSRQLTEGLLLRMVLHTMLGPGAWKSRAQNVLQCGFSCGWRTILVGFDVRHRTGAPGTCGPQMLDAHR